MTGSQEIDKLKPYIQEIFKRVLKNKYSKRQKPYDKKSFSLSSLIKKTMLGKCVYTEAVPFSCRIFPWTFIKIAKLPKPSDFLF